MSLHVISHDPVSSLHCAGSSHVCATFHFSATHLESVFSSQIHALFVHSGSSISHEPVSASHSAFSGHVWLTSHLPEMHLESVFPSHFHVSFAQSATAMGSHDFVSVLHWVFPSHVLMISHLPEMHLESVFPSHFHVPFELPSDGHSSAGPIGSDGFSSMLLVSSQPAAMSVAAASDNQYSSECFITRFLLRCMNGHA